MDDFRPSRPSVPCRVRLASDTRGSAAVEFALVSPMFLIMILFLISIGYMLFMTQALDFATQKAARQIRTGSVQAAQLTQTTFRTNVVCPLLPSMFNCSNVIVNVQPVSTTDGSYPNEYYNFVSSNQSGLIIPTLSNTTTSYCPGQGQPQPTYVYVQVLYPVTLFLSMLSNSTIATTYNGQKTYLIMATATVLNEPFSAPASAC